MTSFMHSTRSTLSTVGSQTTYELAHLPMGHAAVVTVVIIGRWGTQRRIVEAQAVLLCDLLHVAIYGELGSNIGFLSSGSHCSLSLS